MSPLVSPEERAARRQRWKSIKTEIQMHRSNSPKQPEEEAAAVAESLLLGAGNPLGIYPGGGGEESKADTRAEFEFKEEFKESAPSSLNIEQLADAFKTRAGSGSSAASGPRRRDSACSVLERSHGLILQDRSQERFREKVSPSRQYGRLSMRQGLPRRSIRQRHRWWIIRRARTWWRTCQLPLGPRLGQRRALTATKTLGRRDSRCVPGAVW